MPRHTWLLVFVPLLLSASSRAGENAPSDEEAIYQGKTLSEWIGDLRDPKWEKQRAAPQGLAVFGPRKEVVSELTTALKDTEDVWLVVEIARTLGKFGSSAKESIPALRVRFNELEKPRGKMNKQFLEDARQSITEALILIDDHPSPDLAPILIKALQTADAGKRRDIIAKLGKLGPEAAKTTVPALVAVLANTEERVTEEAERARQSASGSYPTAMPSSANADPIEKVKEIRVEAVKSLRRIGSAAKPALHALTLAMKSAAPDKNTRVQQMNVSDKTIGSADGTFLPISFTIVTGDKAMLQACAEAMGRIRPEAKGTVGALRLALRDLDEGVRWAALCALLESGQDTKDVVPILLKFVRDKDAAVRRVAVQSLGKSGSEAKQIVPALTAALKDDDASVRREAAESLGKIRPTDKEVVPALMAVLSDKEDSVVASAAEALSKFGARATAAVPLILPLLRNSDPEKRGRYCILLSEFGSRGKEAIPVLEKLARDDAEELVRLTAYTALAKIDPSRLKDTLSRLLAALQDKKEEVREAAAGCLILLGPEARDALPALRTLRESSDDSTKKVIGEVMEQINKPKK